MLLGLRMTIGELNSVACYQGWFVQPQSGPPLALSPRERQVLDSVLGGRTHKEVAFDLGVSDVTVRVLYSRAMRKLGRARSARGVSAPTLRG